jgi:hypothetical protein
MVLRTVTEEAVLQAETKHKQGVSAQVYSRHRWTATLMRTQTVMCEHTVCSLAPPPANLLTRTALTCAPSRYSEVTYMAALVLHADCAAEEPQQTRDTSGCSTCCLAGPTH